MSAAALRLDGLRALLNTQFPDAVPVPRRTTDAVATGVQLLDAILPNGGFPKGRLSVWAPQGGVTAILRAAAQTTAATGERVAWIDGEGTIAGAWWEEGPILLRPTDRVHALRAAEQLVRSGGFTLVVVTGAESVGTENVRLSRAAHEGGAALVACSNNAAMAALKIVSRLDCDAYQWDRDPYGDPAAAVRATIHVHASALGWSRKARIPVSVAEPIVASALSPTLPDRRGVSQPQLRMLAPSRGDAR